MSAPPGLRVLLVDDMPEIRALLRLLISETIRADIVEARDGLEAIEHILQRPPDLVLCDLNMPGMTGFEMLGFLHRQKDRPACPIIMLTSESDDETRMQAIELSIDAYLRKPFETASVLQTLRAFVPQEYFRSPQSPG